MFLLLQEDRYLSWKQKTLPEEEGHLRLAEDIPLLEEEDHVLMKLIVSVRGSAALDEEHLRVVVVLGGTPAGSRGEREPP